MWRTSERWRSGWDGEFESPLLQQGVTCEPDGRSILKRAHRAGRLGGASALGGGRQAERLVTIGKRSDLDRADSREARSVLYKGAR